MNQFENQLLKINQDLLRINGIKGFERDVEDYDDRRARTEAWSKLFYEYIANTPPDEYESADLSLKKRFIYKELA